MKALLKGTFVLLVLILLVALFLHFIVGINMFGSMSFLAFGLIFGVLFTIALIILGIMKICEWIGK